MTDFKDRITSPEVLAGIVGLPTELAIRKQRSTLDQHMIDFIAQSPFVLIGTYSTDGRCDVSPRGDFPSVAKVLDPQTLVLPERAGNRRADTIWNIYETRRIGLLFLIPGLGETLRVNGRACLTNDRELLKPLAMQGKEPLLGIGVSVEECFLQCAKALIRSRLWKDRPSVESNLPCFAQILMDQTNLSGHTVESLQQFIDEAYTKNLY